MVGAFEALHLGPRSIKYCRRLLADGTVKQSGTLRVGRAVEPPHPVSTSQLTMSHARTVKPLWDAVMGGHTAIEPARALMVGALKPGHLIVAPGSDAFTPAWGMRSGRGHVSGTVVPGGGDAPVMRRRVTWRVTMLPDIGQRSTAGQRLDRFRGGVQTEGPVVRVFTVGTFESRNRAHVCRVFLVERGQALTLKPGDGGVQTGWTRTVPVDHGAGGRGSLRPPWFGVSGFGRRSKPTWSIVATLLLLAVAEPLAFRQRRGPLPLTWKQQFDP